MLKVKNREYKTIKWEKRKDQILAYEKMYKAQVEELKKSLNSGVSSNAERWCLLKLSYASRIVMKKLTVDIYLLV